MTLMQCMQRVHSLLSIFSLPSSIHMQSVGQRSMTSFWMSNGPQSRPEWAPALGGIRRRCIAWTASWSILMSSFQVPMKDMSARAMEATQQLGQPSNLNLNL
jgi:hypothetical protein